MKPREILICSLLLTGCSQLTTSPETDEVVDVEAERQEAVAKSVEDVAASSTEAAVAEDATAPEEDYLPVADWLVQRQGICKQDWESIQTQLQRYQQSLTETHSPPDQNTEVAQAYAQLKALMLATCRPARTPGLLNELLSSVTRYDWPPEYSALFSLLEDEYSAYALLEEKYRQLEERHQKTIDGIGHIEQSLEPDTESAN